LYLPLLVFALVALSVDTTQPTAPAASVDISDGINGGTPPAGPPPP